MKKLTLVVAALLALAMTACVFTAPEVEAEKARVIYTEDGKAFVNLSIGISDSSGLRALTENMAVVAVERYEVAFYYATDTQTYRAAWTDGQRGNLWVQTNPGTAGVNYGAGGNTAILFAGYSNGTLLAVGEIHAVNGSVGVTTIDETSRTVTFKLTPLNNNIYGIGGLNSPVEDSTFQITEAGYETSLISGGDFPTVKINGHDYPVYELDTEADSTATVPGDYEATYSVENLPATGIVLAAAPKVIPKMVEVPRYYKAMDVTGVFTDPVTVGNNIGNSAFELTLTTKSNVGLIKICIEVPIFALSNTTGVDVSTGTAVPTMSPGTWFIRGGISNTVLDMGIDWDSEGGAVLLGISSAAQSYEMPSEAGWINVDPE